MTKYELFFQQLKLLEIKHKKLNETSEENFNIFAILLNSSDEVNLHSKFIYELLNPDGTHQKGNVFLDLFIKEININFIYKHINIYKEKHNIDILIQSKEQSIIIENKIYTEDHSKQLSKYLNTILDTGYIDKDVHLIYLTLFGDEPNEIIVQDKIINISYEIHITNWLESCIKEVAMTPILRETIAQYLTLVKQLTNQSKFKGYIMEVKDFLLSDIANFETAIDIQKSIIESKIDVQLNFWKELKKSLNDSKYEFDFYSSNGDKSFKKSVDKFYKQQKNKRYFGLKLHMSENLYFYIELNWNIYYGFSTFQKGEITNNDFEIIKGLSTSWEEKEKGLFLKYPNKRLDFERFNHKNVLNLIESKLREESINEISNDIVALLDEFTKISNKT